MNAPILNGAAHPLSAFHRYNGRCKLCRRGFSLFARRGENVFLPCLIPFGYSRLHGWRETFTTDEGFRYLGYNAGEVAVCCPCVPTGHPVVLGRVAGKFKLDHKCDARCMSATGHNCECACGGANHGAGHSL